MVTPLKLMCILAHPDDESNGTGGTLAKYAAEGVETYLITATRGERGWQGPPDENPGLDALGKLREGELRAAAKVLGVREVCLLDYLDGDLDQVDSGEATAKIAQHIRRIRPQVVVTWGPEGGYGHVDHIAISQLATGAVFQAADPAFSDANAPHCISKLYYMALAQQKADAYFKTFGDIRMSWDDVTRRVVVWPDWAIVARLETADYWKTIWQAVSCHCSQLPGYDKLSQYTEEDHRELWARETYYRVFSLVNGGRRFEDDLFEGLR